MMAPLRPTRLAASTLGVMLWNCLRLALQFVWIVMLARTLSAEGYGLFSGLAALGFAFGGMVGLGLGLRMYQDVARQPNLYRQRWSQTWQGMKWSGHCLAAVFFCLASWQFTEAGWLVVAALAVSEVLLAPIATQSAFAYAAHGRTVMAAAVPTLLSLGRAVAALTFLLIGGGLESYAFLHALSTALAIALLLVIHRRDLGHPTSRARLAWADLREGLSFSAVWASSIALTSLDKVAVLSFGSADAAGQYTAAHRLMSVVTLPIDALVLAVMPRLFRLEGAAAHGSPLFLLIVVTAVYGIFGGCVLFLSAGALPWLLGQSFVPAVDAVRTMAFIVPLYCLRILGCNVLLGLGRKHWRVCSELVAMGTFFTLAGLRLPDGGAQSAAQALLVAESILVLLVWAPALLTPARQPEPAR